jgi:hypothetical protein
LEDDEEKQGRPEYGEHFLNVLMDENKIIK